MNIGIIGYGVVGKAINNTLSKKYNVIKYDKFFDYNKFTDLLNCEQIFISVPTPFDSESNKVDLSSISESLDSLTEIDYTGIVIIKSTIPPGVTDKFNDKHKFGLCFNPEFLRESTSPDEDFANQDLVLIGTHDVKTFESVKLMYSRVLKSDVKYELVTPKVAEMVKYAQNTTLASRVAIANIIFDACKTSEIDYSVVKSLAFDHFEILGPHMVEVPGPDGSRGFGGKCLPKDIMGFNSTFDSEVLTKIIDYNKTLRSDLD